MNREIGKINSRERRRERKDDDEDNGILQDVVSSFLMLRNGRSE